MTKRLAFVIDCSGSMFLPAGSASTLNKIEEVRQSLGILLEELRAKVTADGDSWRVSIWHFANDVAPLVPETVFDSAMTDAELAAIMAQIDPITDPAASATRLGGVLTDIFGAVAHVAGVIGDPHGPASDRRVMFLFSDGNQTIRYDGGLTLADYDATQGDLQKMDIRLFSSQVILKAAGIGPDRLLDTLLDLMNAGLNANTGAQGSGTPKVIMPIGPIEADPAPMLLSYWLAVVNDNGNLPLVGIDTAAKDLLWEQFSLPTYERDEQGEPIGRVNHKEFATDCDEVSKELVFGLTWHHPGRPAIEAVSPSGDVIRSGVAGAYQFANDWLLAFHIPKPEPGPWRVRVTGDPGYRPMRFNLMARGIFPPFAIYVAAEPRHLVEPGPSRLIAHLYLDDKPAAGEFEVVASNFAGDRVTMKPSAPGQFTAEVDAPQQGINPWRVDLYGKLADGRTIRRFEFGEILVGRARNPTLALSPDRYAQGRRHRVEVELRDGTFVTGSQIRFGDGVTVERFTILGPDRALAEILVAADARIGDRQPAIDRPIAKTSRPVRVIAATTAGAVGLIGGLSFDRLGSLVALRMADGMSCQVGSHHDRLVELLAAARDRQQRVRIEVDDQGILLAVTVER